jgi:hypothetical protein
MKNRGAGYLKQKVVDLLEELVDVINKEQYTGDSLTVFMEARITLVTRLLGDINTLEKQ